MTATLDSPPSRVRRLPTRLADPPYDDELRPPGAEVAGGPETQGALALAFGLADTTRPPAPALRLLPPYDDEDDDRSTRACDLPDPRAWAARLVQAVLEVRSGHRPVGQLLRWTAAPVYAAVETAARRTATAGRDRPSRPLVRSVHVSCPTDTSAEVCALLWTGSRARAVALRLDGYDGRWLCTALEWG